MHHAARHAGATRSSGATVLSNKEMQLTRPVEIAASQLISSVGRTMVWRA
jgi:hypothetical protein